MARHPDDFYRTPPDAVAALDGLVADGPWFDFDPAAGDGGLLAASAMVRPDVALVRGIELDAERAAHAAMCGFDVRCGDGLAVDWRGSNVVANPPFSGAQPFVAKAALEAASAAVLLPLSFLSTNGRAEWWQSLPAPKLCVLAARLSFLASGKTANQEYAWYLWGPMFAAAPPVSWYLSPLDAAGRRAWAAESAALRLVARPEPRAPAVVAHAHDGPTWPPRRAW